MDVSETIAATLAQLPPAERRVAEVVLRDPEGVAFGTVADVAGRARTSGPSVVRLAGRLGFDGFVGLQGAVRQGLRLKLRPAVERVRGAAGGGRAVLLGRALEAEVTNVRSTLEAIAPAAFEAAVARLAAAGGRVFVLPSEQARGVGVTFAGELGIVRDGVQLLGGSDFRVVTRLTAVRRRDTVVVMDFRRHERWLVRANAQVASTGAARIVLVDSAVSPLAEGAHTVWPIAAAGAGPFDSHVGMLAAANALLAGVAARCRRALARRLDALETTWVSSGALVED